MTTLLFALLLGGANTVTIHSGAEVQARLGQQVQVEGQIERVKARDALGTAVVLDDDTVIYVTYGAPPEGWAVGAFVRVEGLLSPSLDDDQRTLMAPHLRLPGKPVIVKRALESLVNRHVRLCGRAQNAKGGAVLLLGRAPVYLEGLDAWPADATGQLVAAGGTVKRRAHLPAAKKNEKGEWSQGAAGGPQWVLEAPSWRVQETGR